MRPNTSLAFLILPILFAAMLSSVHFEAHGQPQPPLPNFPGQGAYGNLGGLICGKRGATWNLKELPWIGCFGLSIGRTASGIVEAAKLKSALMQKGRQFAKLMVQLSLRRAKYREAYQLQPFQRFVVNAAATFNLLFVQMKMHETALSS